MILELYMTVRDIVHSVIATVTFVIAAIMAGILAACALVGYTMYDEPDVYIKYLKGVRKRKKKFGDNA